ncbi:hypothetical protein [Bacillus thuringiensis]|uniref:hypothetical protein n=1 Tax=Bacillus thuringiensis TaxID=1428 RepID=UPI0015D4B328|nr:hypothetical protein [Bacillus thuringiensis]
MDIKVNKLKMDDGWNEGGAVLITTKTHTIVINTKHIDDAYYIASNLEDCADEIEVIEN